MVHGKGSQGNILRSQEFAEIRSSGANCLGKVGNGTGRKHRMSWPCPTCCQLSRGAQGGLILQIAPADTAGTTTHTPKIQESIGRGFCSGTHCLMVIMAGLLGVDLFIVLCYAAVWYWRERKRRILEEKLKAGGWSRDIYSRKS